MLYRPEAGRLWDPTVLKWRGTYYMFTMYYAAGEEQSYACRLATSPDGVHWTDRGNVLTDTLPVFKCGVFKCGERFYMNYGSDMTGENDTLGYAVSEDLLHWEKLGCDHPDPRWYEPRGRWDHMYVRESDRGGYIGGVVAVPLPGINGLCGLRRSADGLHWETLPPPEIDWQHCEPVREMEVGGLEKLGGKWYLMGGICPPYCGHYGYGAYVFESEREEGPYHPCRQPRLCGQSGLPGAIFMSCLPCLVHNYDDPDAPMLCSSSVYYDLDDGHNLCWAVPLCRILADEDGLHLSWWEGNRALRGEPLASGSLSLSTKAHPGYQLVDEYADSPVLSFDTAEGVWLEGMLTVSPCPARAPIRAGVWRPTAAGFAVLGHAMLVEAGDLRWCHARFGTWDNGFVPLDGTRPDDATVSGIPSGEPVRVRLLMQYGVGMLFLNDRLCQLFVCRHTPGTLPDRTVLSLAAQNASVSLTDMKAYRLNHSV